MNLPKVSDRPSLKESVLVLQGNWEREDSASEAVYVLYISGIFDALSKSYLEI